MRSDVDGASGCDCSLLRVFLRSQGPARGPADFSGIGLLRSCRRGR
ncbi:hypothetical protein HMPREF9056_00766 [Actinomyces sp. oral taxon 170 str. F0386]|nr:hypothetical protein HMPREF9056_00766 [Actinomyces sp. oral taxon 170 str. F0386]